MPWSTSHGEEAAVVVLRAVLADQPDLAAVQPAAIEREGELVLRPAQRRQIQLGAGRLPDAVDQQFDHPLLGDGRSVQQRGGGLHRHARHGHRRLDVDRLHGDVRLRRAVAVDEDNGRGGEGERGRREMGRLPLVSLAPCLPFSRSRTALPALSVFRLATAVPSPSHDDALHVGQDVNLLVRGVGFGQQLAGLLQLRASGRPARS